MSVTQVIALDRPVDELGPTELQAAAREAYRRAVTAGPAPTGAKVGSWFGRSDRWGRDRIAEARAEDDAAATGAAATAPLPAAAGDSVAATGSRREESLAAAETNGPVAGTAAAAVAATDSPDRQPEPPPAAGGNDPDDQWTRRIIRWTTTAAVIVVAACAARPSYEHQRTVVEMTGDHDAAWYLPLSVDGMMLIASLNMLVRRWDGQKAGWLTWTALLLGGAASLAANIAAAQPTWTGRLVAAWSPLCLIVSYELLLQQLPNRCRQRGVQ